MQHRIMAMAYTIVFSIMVTNYASGRVWTSANGGFQIDAEAISFNDTLIVLKRPTGELVAVELKELSNEDQEFVKSKEAKELQQAAVDELQTWTAKDGMKVTGRVLAYGRRNMVIQRKLGQD